MKLIAPKSLAKTLDNINDALFFGKTIPAADKRAAAQWIAGRQGLPGSYAGMFAPTQYDYTDPVPLFTGEKLQSHASTGHILGQEACRTLIKLNVKNKSVTDALTAATENITARIKNHRNTRYHKLGWYCCGTCSVSYWRHLAAGGYTAPERSLAAGVRILKANRDNKGKWRRFPFYYTLLALSEIESAAALAELNYARPTIQRALKSKSADPKLTRRRHTLAENILNAID